MQYDRMHLPLKQKDNEEKKEFRRRIKLKIKR